VNLPSLYWEYFPHTVVGFTVLVLLNALVNYFAIRRLDQYPEPGRFPRVSILVPARNEAHNIEVCVRSLIEQDYPDFEVLVLDDHSTDGTNAVLEGLARHNPRLRVLNGKPLPMDWLGKHWACHQLAQAATGDLLLFTDADTRHAPNMLRDSVSALFAEDTDLLTIFPQEEVVTWGEKLTVPAIGFFIFSVLPVTLIQWMRWSSLSLAIGQFMLFRREAFESVGGYESVRGNVLDDVSLARRIVRQGYGWRFMDGTLHVSCRMYRGFWEAVDGFTKNIFAFFDFHVLLFLIAWLWIETAYLLPPLVLYTHAVGMPLEIIPYNFALIATAVSFLSWLPACYRFRFPLHLAFLYPVILSLFVLIALRSMTYNVLGQTFWKDRALIPPLWRW
jgi:chlorobactene glucosyltransferase